MRPSLSGVALAALIAALYTAPMAHASTLTPIYSFCAVGDCADGRNPAFPLTMDGSGNLYGVTDASSGASNSPGVLFELTNKRGKWKEKVLHQFCGNADCSHGAIPTGRVAVDPNGNLLGTTLFGNGLSSNDGVLYEMTAKGQYSVLAKFCDPCSANGSHPTTGLTWRGAQTGAPWDGTAQPVGTTDGGGANGGGTAYAVGKDNHGNYIILTFVSFGTSETAGQIIDGNPDEFYTSVSHQHGSIFKDGAPIWQFCASGTKCKEGSQPGMLTVNVTGDLFGVTQFGGKKGDGTVFELAGPKYKKIAVVHNVCTARNCADGTGDVGPMVVDATGNVWGAMSAGGANGKGVIFKIGTDGSYATTYSFCALANCADGATPQGGLTIDPAGNLYGTTSAGGSLGQGEVFEFTP